MEHFGATQQIPSRIVSFSFVLDTGVGTPEADQTCNVGRSREVLGLTYQGDLEQYPGGVTCCCGVAYNGWERWTVPAPSVPRRGKHDDNKRGR
jgi:hypothetical protein